MYVLVGSEAWKDLQRRGAKIWTLITTILTNLTLFMQGSYLPPAFRGRYDRASTAPAGKTRTIAAAAGAGVTEDDYLDIERVSMTPFTHVNRPHIIIEPTVGSVLRQPP